MALLTLHKETIRKWLYFFGSMSAIGLVIGVTGTSQGIAILAGLGYVFCFTGIMSIILIHKVFVERLEVDIFEKDTEGFKLEDLVEVE